VREPASAAPAAQDAFAVPISAPPADSRWREQARQGIRPTRQGGSDPGTTEQQDLRDEGVSLHDSDVEEHEESDTDLLARQLGAEIIGEEQHGG